MPPLTLVVTERHDRSGTLTQSDLIRLEQRGLDQQALKQSVDSYRAASRALELMVVVVEKS